MGSCFQQPIETLAVIMTMQMYFGRFDGLNVTLIGDLSPMLNSFMCTLPRMGVNITVNCSEKVSFDNRDFSLNSLQT